MPYISSQYCPSPLLSSGHLETIYPSLFKKVDFNYSYRTILSTPDEDIFAVDVAISTMSTSKLVILLHGLEGSSYRHYIRGMCKIMTLNGFNCFAKNCRGCGGLENKLPQLYHMGQIDDLETTISYAIKSGYSDISLIGFSMGGNQVLNYLGRTLNIPKEVKRAVVFSVPCYLPDCVKELDKFSNKIYTKYFLTSLKEKIKIKNKKYPKLFPLNNIDSISTFNEFDERYTAPIHNFNSAKDYWEKSSCKPYLKEIKIPVLIVNAKNDPFLSSSCYPIEDSLKNNNIHLEIPYNGGHVGFIYNRQNGFYWSENRALNFIKNL